jgi:Ca2+/H+ antiporter, TMEM165/GDT1 family
LTTTEIVLLVTVAVASTIEVVEAITIILASGITRGWRSTFEGTALAIVLLGAIVAIAGPALVNYVPLNILRIVVGTLLLIFGLQWLYKNILRTAGYKALHDEALIYQKNVAKLSKEPGAMKGQRDPVAFVISFKGVFLEGMEIVIIVISFGAPANQLLPCALVAAAVIVVVGTIGAFMTRPLSKVPEEYLKMSVGVILALFGTFWMGEGANIEWPLGDAFLLVLLALLLVVTFGLIFYLRKTKKLVPEVTA